MTDENVNGPHPLAEMLSDLYLVDADDCAICSEPIPASVKGPVCERHNLGLVVRDLLERVAKLERAIPKLPDAVSACVECGMGFPAFHPETGRRRTYCSERCMRATYNRRWLSKPGKKEIKRAANKRAHDRLREQMRSA